MQTQYLKIQKRFEGTPIGSQEVFPLLLLPTLPTPSSLYPVQIVNADTLDTALLVPKTVLLNMANPHFPGGYPFLVGAQEEDLFRRTNLHRYLTADLYPIANKVILSKEVTVVAKGLRESYASMAPQHIDIISCSAIRNMTLGPVMKASDAHIMARKIATVLDVARRQGYHRIVLSAFGCGGFQCPPEHVSRIFRDLLPIYAGGMEVVFAIWDECYPKSNYAVFRETLDPAS
jgi:uncharacterized protein (TIGR02452 family)